MSPSENYLTGGTVTITGTDIDGATLTEVFDLSTGVSLTGSEEFHSVTSIVVASLAGIYTGYTLSVGIGGTVQVKKGAGLFGGITLGETAAGAIKVIDGTSGSTTNMGELKASITEGDYFTMGMKFAQGLRVILGAASKVTVAYA